MTDQKYDYELVFDILDLDKAAQNQESDIMMLDPSQQVLNHSSQLNETLADLFGQVQDNAIDSTASCSCGQLKGNFRVGKLCNICKTEVRIAKSTDIAFNCWIKIPELTNENITTPPIMHPIVYACFDKWMGVVARGASDRLLECLLDPKKNLPEGLVGKVQQGLHWWSKNFRQGLDVVFEYMASINKAAALRKKDDIIKFVDMHEHKFFTRHIPVLNNSLHMINKVGRYRYTDACSQNIVMLYNDLNSIYYNIFNRTYKQDKISSLMMLVQKAYVKYAIDSESGILHIKLSGKKGMIRNHLSGSRLFWTFRGVIVPTVTAHEYDELHMPWRTVVYSLKIHILNILINRYGYSPDAADFIHRQAMIDYNPLVDEVLHTLKSESRENGFMVFFGRNPTLEHGSIQLLRVTKWSKDVSDNVISVSPRIRKKFNFDFDEPSSLPI